MVKLIAVFGLVGVLSGCVAYPGYGYADSGYGAYGPEYVPAFGYGTVNIWGGGGWDHRHGHGDFHHGWRGHGGGNWGGGGRGGGGHGGHGGGHGR
ncbi:hypothetical protein [Paraburkholderia hospita]|uniref:Lipoprotein n=1 Tax=Paraburkholderia hospita TaxID=169430 RepID=A0AAJ5BAB6_9BURK|nr:hypothetical protein [Paraburkholderia hospita]AUT76622.1 hypothetical protein C2L64_51825 [Paraburkholderia hospita]AXF05763.1 hypothetical protein CUJ88_45875 [Paraburkholderia hospita]OUL86890.1 hypothetical protein CA603_21995 [Paraburkholderia hospita]SEI26211.1 hypothetical protein SAMN05192544_106736 [Paraburkholderia hospita]